MARESSIGGRRQVRRRTGARKKTIGWKEWISFPDLGVGGVRTKVDTGARTSALHAIDLTELVLEGTPAVRFHVSCDLNPSNPPTLVQLPLVDRRPVRDSGGREELRPVVRTEIELHDERWEIELTLTRRDDMEFNMLLGRRAIRGRFVVDPEQAFIAGAPRLTDLEGGREADE